MSDGVNHSEAIEAILDSVAEHAMYTGITGFNDNPLNPRRLLAEVWAKAMRRLGYRKRGDVFVMPIGNK
jgi:hypothetical protein